MNGFLISVPGRTFLSKVIKDERITETPDVCPTRGASQRTLLSIASTYLKEGIRNNKRHLRNFTGNETKNRRLLQNSRTIVPWLRELVVIQ
jgi:hypothetical protein